SLTDSNGQLRGELGVIRAEYPLNSMVYNINETIKISAKLFVSGNSPKVTITVSLTAFDYAQILSTTPQAKFTSENGFEIEWLKWLLLDGDAIIIQKYFFKKANQLEKAKFSRTGLGVMRRIGSGIISGRP